MTPGTILLTCSGANGLNSFYFCYKKDRNLSVNDVVLVVDKVLPRSAQCMRRVTEVYPDSNDLVRTARVRTKHSVILRPISKLCLTSSDDKRMN